MSEITREQEEQVEVYCGIWRGHCDGCEVGSGKYMTHRIKCTGPDWVTGRHSTFIDADHPYAQNTDNRVKP
jgi:hypothetical protein